MLVKLQNRIAVFVSTLNNETEIIIKINVDSR